MHFPRDISSIQTLVSGLPQAKIAKVISAILLCYIAYLAAKLTWLVIPTSVDAPLTQINPVVTSSTEPRTTDISPIQRLNLFGVYNEQKVIAPVQVQDAPETKLRLTLTGTVASSDPDTAAAIIENNGKQETYGIGEKITGTRATLESVAADRVLIKVSGSLETLMLDGFKYSKPTTISVLSQPQHQGNHQAEAAVIDQRDNEELSESALQLREDLVQNPGSIADYLKISPLRENDEIKGFRLMPGSKAEFFKNAGLKSGDVAVQMNGLDLTNPSDAAQALQTLKEETEISLLIDRNGVMTEILFSIQ
ncbi:type II secretion system protein GspC [Thalassotalea marina]|uniref:Type II secretion system protein GspC n=1 Tax=Thalassotalea marina TaxID=1673741 RepID=A0A919BPI5_9GAMM|nr:type II secretion system protein GspC [Thalassotalea marina]GHG03886.1 type II secretion system protein GspC [Thalassotalea marina]